MARATKICGSIGNVKMSGKSAVGGEPTFEPAEIYQVLRRHQSRQPLEAGQKPDICRELWCR